MAAADRAAGLRVRAGPGADGERPGAARPRVDHLDGSREVGLQRGAVPQARARRRRVGGGRRARRLQGRRLGQLRQGRAGHQHLRPVGDRGRAGQAGLLHRARARPGPRLRPGAGAHGDRGDDPGLRRRRGRHARARARPRLRDEQLGLPLLLARGRARDQPPVALHDERQHDGPRDREGRARGPRQPRQQGDRPYRRYVALRRAGQPLPLGRRRRQPVRVLRLRADRRAARPRALRRPGHLGQHQRPARQAPADQARAGRHVLDPARQPVRAR